MSSTTDLDINRAVRRLFVKHWIDLGRVAVRTVRGHVMLHGRLERIEGVKEPLQPPTVEAMFYEMGRLPGVGTVRAHLENWTNEGGRWQPFERAALALDRQDERRGNLPPVAARLDQNG